MFKDVHLYVAAGRALFGSAVVGNGVVRALSTVLEPLSLALMDLGLFAMTIARQRRFKRVSVERSLTVCNKGATAPLFDSDI